jgi:hypothetical protein
MGEDDRSGGDFASITPSELKQTADALKKSMDGVNSNVPGLKKDFGFFGIGTGHLDSLSKGSSVLSTLIPELRRRQSLAAQLVAENPAGGSTVSYQGDLLGKFKTVEAAVARAHINADIVLNARKNRQPIPDSVYKDLQDNGDDPDYAEAFFKHLGPAGTTYVLIDSRAVGPSDADEQSEWKRQALGNTFATASHRMKFDADYIASISNELRALGLPTNAAGSMTIFTPMLEYGRWDSATLQRIADLAFKKHSTDVTGPIGGDELKHILNGLSNNQLAAGEYFSKNRDLLYDAGKFNSNFRDHGPASEAYARFVLAATVDDNGEFARWAMNGGPKPNLAEQNAQYLVKKVANDPKGEWGHDMRLTFASITQAYMDDIGWSIGSPADAGSVDMPARDGIEVSQADWKAFIKEPMRDDEAAARVAVTFSTWLKKNSDYTAARTSDDPDANFWDAYTQGRMRGLFLVGYQAVQDEKGRSAEEQKAAIEGAVGKAVDWAADPAGIPKDIMLDLTKGLLGTVASKLGENPGKPLDLEDFSDNNVWRTTAESNHKAGKIKPYDDGDVTWEGKPDFYEELYGGKFTNSDGSIKSMEDLKKDPKAMQAYNQWLKDPAVQASVADHYRDEDLGQNDASLPGG